MVQAASFLFKERRNLELPQSSKANGCGRWSSQGALYKRRNLGKLTTHRVQRKNVKQNEFHSVPKGAFSLQIRATSWRHHWIRLPYFEAFHVIPKEEALMATHLVRRNARSVPWVAEETLASVRRQGSTNHDVGPRTSKSPSLSESPNSVETAPPALFFDIGPNPREWVELCYCLSKWRFDWLYFSP